MRLLGPTLKLWDVRDVEGHVRTLLEVWLNTKPGAPAYLEPAVKDLTVDYLVATCWRLSGLNHDGTGPRFIYAARLRVAFAEPQWSSIRGNVVGFTELTKRFSRPAAAQLAGEQRVRELQSFVAAGDEISFEVVPLRPSGAYDRRFGLSFSTYSRRILTLRIADWYRQHFGDSRYEKRSVDRSLDDLFSGWQRDDDAADGYLDRHGPGSREDLVDELNRHAYRDAAEEVLTNLAVAV